MNQILMFFLYLIPVMAVAAPRTICTATINSDNEKKVFEKYLKGKNFKFVELTDFQPKKSKASNSYADEVEGGDDAWFQKACDAGVQCDVLVISGHFSSNSFFSTNNNLALPVSSLQQRSCSKTCDGILRTPKEVYLLGCNTLALKDADLRTPERYRQDLISDGIEPSAAALISGGRYSPFGESNREIMQKAFQGVPAIYGFESFAPKGNQIGPFLDKYMTNISDYSHRLDQLEAQKVMTAVTGANRILQGQYADWGKVMGSGRFSHVECHGSNDNFDLQCTLFDDDKTRYEKLLAMEKMVNSPDRMKYVFSMKAYLDSADLTSLSPSENATLERIRNNSLAKKDYLETLSKLKSPAISLPFFYLGRELGWASDQNLENYLSQNINTGLKDGDDQAICQASQGQAPIDLKMSSLTVAALKDPHALKAIGCLGVTDSRLLVEMAGLMTDPKPEIVDAVTNSLLMIHPKDIPTAEKLSQLLENANLQTRSNAMTMISNLQIQSPLITQQLAKTLRLSDQKDRAKLTLRLLKPKDPETLRIIRSIDPSVLTW